MRIINISITTLFILAQSLVGQHLSLGQVMHQEHCDAHDQVNQVSEMDQCAMQEEAQGADCEESKCCIECECPTIQLNQPYALTVLTKASPELITISLLKEAPLRSFSISVNDVFHPPRV